MACNNVDGGLERGQERRTMPEMQQFDINANMTPLEKPYQQIQFNLYYNTQDRDSKENGSVKSL